MSYPILRTGKSNKGQQVYELNGQEVTLTMGFNPTQESWGYDDKGRPRFSPTRTQRRAARQKANRRHAFGYQKQLQIFNPGKNREKGKVIIHAVIAKQTGHGGTNI